MAQSAIAVADQVIVSAAHFLIGLSVARSGDAVALGVFGIGFMLVHSAADLHRALIWLPMSQRVDVTQLRTARRLGVTLGVVFSAVVWMGATSLLLVGRPDWALMAAGVALALPVYFWHEIQRRIAYALLQPQFAAATGAVYVAVAAAGVLWVPPFTSVAIGSAIRALFILAGAGLAGGLTGLIILRKLPESAWTLRTLASHYAPASKAYVLNAAMVFASQRFSLLVLATVVGVDALGRIEAARLLTAPLMVVALGLAAMAVPMVGHAFRVGAWPSIQPLLDRLTLASIVIAGSYGVILIIAGTSLSFAVFDTVYDHGVTLGLMYCGIAAASLVSSALIAPLGAAGKASLVPRARIPGVLLVVIAAFPAAHFLGEHGVLGLVLIESTLSATLLRRAVNISSATVQ